VGGASRRANSDEPVDDGKELKHMHWPQSRRSAAAAYRELGAMTGTLGELVYHEIGEMIWPGNTRHGKCPRDERIVPGCWQRQRGGSESCSRLGGQRSRPRSSQGVITTRYWAQAP